jgi:hypothetical protein
VINSFWHHYILATVFRPFPGTRVVVYPKIGIAFWFESNERFANNCKILDYWSVGVKNSPPCVSTHLIRLAFISRLIKKGCCARNFRQSNLPNTPVNHASSQKAHQNFWRSPSGLLKFNRLVSNVSTAMKWYHQPCCGKESIGYIFSKILCHKL